MGTNNYLLIEIGGAKHRAGPMIGSWDRQLYQQGANIVSSEYLVG